MHLLELPLLCSKFVPTASHLKWDTLPIRGVGSSWETFITRTYTLSLKTYFLRVILSKSEEIFGEFVCRSWNFSDFCKLSVFQYEWLRKQTKKQILVAF